MLKERLTADPMHLWQLSVIYSQCDNSESSKSFADNPFAFMPDCELHHSISQQDMLLRDVTRSAI